ALKAGGVLLFAENLTSTKVHEALRKKHNKWGDYWRYVSLSEFDYLLESFSSYDVKSTGVLGTLGRTEGQKNFLTGIDELSFNHLAPASWHYIGYGMAKK
ncbi:MAG TPA: hypothetical protein VJ949_07395, partial [Cryomorphaceae bacterium]|nr:hypothetical protein [Cryomorphaceae bacterium]